ncbi:phage minor tail protein L [Yersinia massiliensis]|uniref:Phage minor tail protein L n=1 Tax=Yersinia massiliensis TaxID=419257 RepID=A0ABM6USR1_9GAMM|nr:phage minor tail protein L [Yersinia massiliensis]AVX37918.1 phage minor tail protein L [Yersinia massiliensis]QKJ12701.1 phage minor tail protein L [Yersinia massiliensis]
MGIKHDYQTLDPGNEVWLYAVDCTAFNGPELFFHNHKIPYTSQELRAADGDITKLPVKSIWWQGVEYLPWPVELTGIEIAGDGTAPTPSLSVGNIDGTISAMCLAYQDLAQAKVQVHKTFSHYLDARNFLEGNPSASPDDETLYVYFIDRKAGEGPRGIQFDLSGPYNMQGIKIPREQIQGSVCRHCMRGWYRTGRGCDYAGSLYFDEDDNPTDDPSRDECSGSLRACKLRHGAEPLPYGAEPGSSLLRR